MSQLKWQSKTAVFRKRKVRFLCFTDGMIRLSNAQVRTELADHWSPPPRPRHVTY